MTDSEESLNFHEKSEHTRYLRVRCEFCHSKVRNWNELRKHQAQAHFTSRGYSCVECEYQSDRELDIKKHT